jgi:hypothetical protein
MGINKSEITNDGTNVFVAEDFVGNLVSDSEYIDVVQGRRPVNILSQSPNTDVIGIPRIDESQRDRLDTPIDISFNQIDFYSPDGTYLPSLEVIINTLVEGAEDYVINYTKLS